MRLASALSIIFCLMLAWIAPAQAGRWVLANQGDCPGPQVIGSAGAEPEDELCSNAFAGKTALCFTQVCYPGCQYIDILTRECRGGTELAQVYTCLSEPTPAQADKPSAAVPQ